MQTPHLYRQLLEQLRQWIVPKDQRHLQGGSRKDVRMEKQLVVQPSYVSRNRLLLSFV